VKEFAYNDVYTVMNTENVVEQMNANIPAPIKHNVELIKSVAFGFSADKSLVFSLVGECLEAVDAQNLRDAVQGLVAMARLGVSGERDLIDFMNEVEVTNEDKKIMINLEVSQERLNKLKSYKDKMKHRGKMMSHELSDCYVAFVNDQLMIAGSENAVKSALDGKSSVKDNTAFMGKVKEFAYNDMYTVVNTEKFKEKVKANLPIH
jgi:hypothetical protein